MKKIKYIVKTVIDVEKEVSIDDDKFIVVSHVLDGKSMLTAFIGKGEGEDKYIILISKMGGVLEIHNMAGSATMNAISLMSKSCQNKIESRNTFNYWLNVNKDLFKIVEKLIK